MIKNLFICPKEIEIETKDLEKVGTSLALKLSLLSQKIKCILLKIESCPSIETADEYFYLLDKIQEVLASLVFKHEIGIPDHLSKFVQDFDNIDHYKDHLFKQIKNGKYSL